MNKKIHALENHLPRLWNQLENCTLCPRRCGVNRKAGERGICQAGDELIVFTAFLHQGEEPPLSGTRGSGTIFFSGCGLRCIYCQNYAFSHNIKGKKITPEDLATVMLNLEKKGAHNINLVTPAHFLPHIAQALTEAFKRGLNIPIIYNTSGFESPRVVAMLSGIVDIYLSDLRYMSPKAAQELSGAQNYPAVNKLVLKEMYRQKKTPSFSGNLLTSGLIIRHLILPGHINETKKALEWIRRNCPQALVSVMAQYQPYYQAQMHPMLNRAITESEYQEVNACIDAMGIENGWLQEYNPDTALAGIHFIEGLNLP